MNLENLRSLIKESINEYIKEIDEAAETAAMEARIAKCDEAIQMREEKLARLESLEEVKDMVDETKVEGIKKEIKELQKAKAKFEKAKEKRANKLAGKKAKKDDVVTDAKIEEAPVDEADVTEKMDVTDEGALNEEMVGGVNYDSVIAAELKAEVGDLSKLTPYVLEKGDNVQSDSSGKIHVTDSETNKKTIYKDIADFLRGVGYQIKMNESFTRMQKIAGIIK